MDGRGEGCDAIIVRLVDYEHRIIFSRRVDFVECRRIELNLTVKIRACVYYIGLAIGTLFGFWWSVS